MVVVGGAFGMVVCGGPSRTLVEYAARPCNIRLTRCHFLTPLGALFTPLGCPSVCRSLRRGKQDLVNECQTTVVDALRVEVDGAKQIEWGCPVLLVMLTDVPLCDFSAPHFVSDIEEHLLRL